MWLLTGSAPRGPSPRIRGELLELKKKMKPDGTIPANTGRISLNCRRLVTLRDHPREYGENYDCGLLVWVRAGPSPRIRGEFPGYHLIQT